MKTIELPHGKVSKGEDFVYKWQYRSLGGFEAKLADLIAHADTGNQKRMVKAFPEEAQAIINYQSKEGYWDKVQDKVEYRDDQFRKARKEW
jgi:rhamnogalacturonyl hydrolase YesR